MKVPRALRIALLVTLALLPPPLSAEVLEEIVAKVDDDVITRTEFLQEEQGMLAEIYRSATGPQLDAQAAEARQELLRRMFERKILLHRAERLYDMDKLGQSLMEQFLTQQKIASEAELERLLAQERMTLASFRRRLIESYVPEEVIRFEVTDRIAIGDREVEAYYAAHPEEFATPAAVTLREVVLLAETPERKEQRRAEAEARRARLAAPGADFAAIATETSEAGTRAEGGLLGPVNRSDLSTELATAAFEQPLGEVGPLLDLPYGFHIVKVESRNDALTRPLDQVREEVRGRLADQEYKKSLAAFLDRAWKESTIWVNPKYADRLSTARPISS